MKLILNIEGRSESITANINSVAEYDKFIDIMKNNDFVDIEAFHRKPEDKIIFKIRSAKITCIELRF